jgi:hypothetical protein
MLQHKVESSLQTGNDDDDSHSRGEQSLLTEQEADGDTNRDKQGNSQIGTGNEGETTGNTESMDARQ